MFLGIVQGLFLSYFFLHKNNRQVKSNLYLGLLLFSSTLLSSDVFISYTNIMVKVLYFVDLSEPLNFLIAPLFYLYIVTKLDESKLKKYYYHFIPSIFWIFYSIFFHIQSLEFKFNAYLNQYHPEIETISSSVVFNDDPLQLKSNIAILIFSSLVIYLVLSIWRIYKASKTRTDKNDRKKLFSLLWFDVSLMSLIPVTFSISKAIFLHDLGDYIIIITITLMMYVITFALLRKSLFFHTKLFETKYSKSGLDKDSSNQLLAKIKSRMENDKYYLKPTASVSDLAKKLGSSPNYISQVINQELECTFPELLSRYRIEEAKILLTDSKSIETIEGIAYSVGYNSKSTFHTAFKKITGQTPAEYKLSQI